MSRPTAHTKAPISEALLEKAANGRLTPYQAKHLTELMASNPFVAEVLESVDHTNWAAIKSISERSTSKVLSRSAKHGGRKRYGWLQWSAVAVLLGTGAFWWIISDHDSKEKGSAISPKQAIVMELEKEAELVKEVLAPDTVVTKIEKHKAPVASSFGQKTPITDSKVSEATLEEVRNPVEGVEEPVATVVHEIAPTVAPLSATPSAGKKYQRLEIVQAHVLGSRIPQEEVKRKKSKKNGQLGGKERVKSVDPIGIKAPSYFGGRKGIERFAYEHLADLNKLDYDYSKQTMAIELTINASGKIANIEVVDKVHPAIDQAAIDIFRAMPKWEEGNTDIVYTVALTFN